MVLPRPSRDMRLHDTSCRKPLPHWHGQVRHPSSSPTSREDREQNSWKSASQRSDQRPKIDPFDCNVSPPLAWFLPGPERMRGAQRGVSLAEVDFVGESTPNPLEERSWKKRLIIKDLRNHDLGVLDSFAESRESSLRKPPWLESSQRKPPYFELYETAKFAFESKFICQSAPP